MLPGTTLGDLIESMQCRARLYNLGLPDPTGEAGLGAVLVD